MIAASPAQVQRAPSAGASRPLILLLLLAAFAFLAIFDTLLNVAFLPLLRNPSAWAAAVLVLLYVWYRREGWPLQHGVQRWMLAFFLFTASVQMVRAVSGVGFEVARYTSWVQILVLALIATDLSRDRRAFGLVWGAVSAGILSMAVLGLAPLPGLGVEAYGRSGFAGLGLNQQGYWYALGFVTMLWLALSLWPRVGWRVPALLAASAILLVALTQTGSRGALLSAVIGSIVVLVLAFRARNVSAYATMVPVALLLAVGYVADASILSERVSAALTGEDLGARDSIVLHGVELIARQPLFGYGTGFARDLGEARGMTRPISSHNSVLQVALAFGLLGLGLWTGILVNAVARAWRSWFTFRQPVGALLVALLTMSVAYGMVNDLGFDKYFWLLVALAAQAPLQRSDAPPRRAPAQDRRRGRAVLREP